MTFYSYIDGFLDNVKNKAVKTVSVDNITGKSFVMHGIKTFNRKVEKREVFISDEYYKLGVDLQWGSTLSYLEDLKNDIEAVDLNGVTKVDSNASKRYNKRAISRHVNLINRYDAGRLVQQSYYGPLDIDGYPNGTFTDGKNGNTIPFREETNITDAVKLLISEKKQHSLCKVPSPDFWAISYPEFKSTENWAAFTGQFDDSFGIALYTPLKDVSFLSGVLNRDKTNYKDPSTEFATSYFAVTQNANRWQFESYKSYEYDFYLTTGTVEEIRANFKEIK